MSSRTNPGLLAPAVRATPGAAATATRLFSGGLLVLLGLRLELYPGISVGMLAALALAPVWWRHVGEHTGGRLVVGLVVLAVASGAWLTALASSDHVVRDRYVVIWSALMIGLASAVGAILWARSVFPPGAVAVLFGLGMVAGIPLNAADVSNPWKSVVAVPLTVLLLGVGWALRRRTLELVALLALAGVSAVNDSRSHFAMLLMAACLVVWQSWFRGGGRPRSALRSVIVLAGVSWAVYSLGQALVLEGYLGEETQARSAAQAEAAGSVVLGGRPEIGATVALMGHRPLGLGTGTSATGQEILVAKGGMARLGYDPNNGYVENYMFGELVELHSIIGDLWVLFGIPGLTLALVIAWVVLHGVGRRLGDRTLSALEAFLAVRILWDLLFGPLYSSLGIVALGVGLLLLRRTPPG